MHNLLHQLHGNIYELTERFERQKYDVGDRIICELHSEKISFRWSNYRNVHVKSKKGNRRISFVDIIHISISCSKAKTRKSNIVHTGLGGGMYVLIYLLCLSRAQFFLLFDPF